MKFNLKYFAVILGTVFLAGCDGDFEELNKDPNSATADRFNPSYLFTTAQLYTARGDENATLYYASCFVQHFASLSNVGIFDHHGDKYVYHKGNNELLWKTTFNPSTGPAVLLEDVLQLSKDKPEFNNLVQMARIWKTIVYHRLTDMYGDIPYSEAGKGYYEQLYKPKYDAQRDIYYHMLSELEDATAKIDLSGNTFAQADIVYKGNLARWKKLGYSMMLRLGMRLSKVEPDVARTWVSKAFTGGVFTSNEDDLFVKFTDATGTNATLSNGQSMTITIGAAPGKIAATYFNYLKNTNDPRLKHTAAVYTNPFDQSTIITDPARQKGLPNGLDRITLPNDPSFDPSRPEQEHQYSGARRDVYGRLDGPRMLLTNAEVQLMLAEAVVRGWISGDAESYYKAGVAAGMKQLRTYSESANISDAEINAYLAANPFAADSEGRLELINTQYWIATFLNGYESFANVRRSGYPKLTPINYPDNETGGKFPGRLRYPEDEAVLNEDNYFAAVAIQGTDNFITKVWWDK